MVKYVIRRVLWIIPVLIGVAALVFTIMYFVPGDPARLILGESATQVELEAKREQLGLNDPYIVQLWHYLSNIFLHFDFGESYRTGISVASEILDRMPRTILIGFTSMIITFVVGIPLGILAGVYQNRFADRFCMFVALAGVSIPTFWLALLLVILFSVNLGWLPSSGISTWQCYILPIAASAFGGTAGLARQSRSSMLEVIRSDYITTARAKGCSQTSIIWKHALPNALMPIITVAGMHLATLFGGSVVIENIFSIPGIGQYMVNGVNNRDYPVVEGSVIILAFIFSLVMLVVDLAYGFIDPRIKARYVSNKTN